MRSLYSRFAKRVPPLFDASKRTYRRLGGSDPVYECLKRFCRTHRRVFFLQIGSNDGISQDPLREFIVRNPDWSGCFVEPLPHLFEKLRRNYSYLGRRNLHFQNSAVSDRLASLRLFRVKSEYHNDFPNYVDQVASVDRSHITSMFADDPDIAQKIEAVSVPAVPITVLLDAFRTTGLNLLHLDVEGHEGVILSAFPFDSFHPDIIIFEEGHLSDVERVEVRQLLKSREYRIYPAGIDAVAIRTPLDEGYADIFAV
jgi:FkbM family methyltransferase